jgi:hypothetical protein
MSRLLFSFIRGNKKANSSVCSLPTSAMSACCLAATHLKYYIASYFHTPFCINEYLAHSTFTPSNEWIQGMHNRIKVQIVQTHTVLVNMPSLYIVVDRYHVPNSFSFLGSPHCTLILRSCWYYCHATVTANAITKEPASQFLPFIIT